MDDNNNLESANEAAIIAQIGKEFVAGDKEKIVTELFEIMVFYLSKTPETATTQDWLHALTILARGLTFTKLCRSKASEKKNQPKFVNYISMEFLIGRSLIKSIDALGILGDVTEILKDNGYSFDDIEDIEPEPGLGNGGLGRLAACFMDSMSALEIPAFGYGIRYSYGMFTQKIIKGQQVEVPDTWLLNGYLWEINRPEIKYIVPFATQSENNEAGATSHVYARAYDVLISTPGSDSISRVRLWSASSSEELVLEEFNVGDYARAFNSKSSAENISSVLYPNDSSESGKVLRLKQEYFLSSASVQDIIFRFANNNKNFNEISQFESIHLNDTHPALAVPEFLRVLTKNYHVSWEDAWAATQKTFSYTNHTLLPEALERWEVRLLDKVLPHVLEIIYRINYEFLAMLSSLNKYDGNLISAVSIIEEGGEKKVRMANLNIVSSHKVNGVSKLHSDLMVKSIFRDFYRISPEKFINVTNGVTQRRWLKKANEGLSKLISSKIGEGWIKNFNELARFKDFAGDEQTRNEFLQVKRNAKVLLSSYLKSHGNFEINPDHLIASQVKRIHEYKRQILNLLNVIQHYNQISDNPDKAWVGRTVIISGKAASAYYMAKLTIRLINDVAEFINNDPRTNKHLRLYFVPDYSVRLAEMIIPASDLSEQISTAGYEASGTGNMKLSMNGALTIGTYDGANIEIMEAVGEQNFFLFGNRVEDIDRIRAEYYDSMKIYQQNSHLKRAIDDIRQGKFNAKDKNRYDDIVSTLLHHDNYLVLADFESYRITQERVDACYLTPQTWAEKGIINVAAMHRFSSDQSIREYAKNVWNVATKD